MRTVKAVAKLTVDIYVDAENIRGAEKLLDAWLGNAQLDERLRSYVVRQDDWVPEWLVPDTIE